MFLLYLLYIVFLSPSCTYGFVTKHSSYSLKDLDNLERDYMNMENFNALDDVKGIMHDDETMDDVDPLIRDEDGNLQINYKKSNLKPKYDPGWKFIGLGKRPNPEQSSTNGNHPPQDQEESVYDDSYPKEYDYLSIDSSNAKSNPLVSFSTLINFEVFNAIKDGIAQAEKETVKKGEGIHSKLFQDGDSNSNKFGSRVSVYNGKKIMYDPGWMLTGLGK